LDEILRLRKQCEENFNTTRKLTLITESNSSLFNNFLFIISTMCNFASATRQLPNQVYSFLFFINKQEFQELFVLSLFGNEFRFPAAVCFYIFLS
jgi:hypothetical protein